MWHARLKVIAVLGPLLVASLGCGGDDDAASQPYIDAAVEDMTDDEDPLPREQAECLATALVDAVGADRLEDEGITPEEFGAAEDFYDFDIELDDGAIDALGDDLGGCDLDVAFAELFAAESGDEISDASIDCVAGDIDDDEFGAVMAQGVVSEETSEDSGEQVIDLVLSGVAACPDAMTELLVNGFNQSMGEELSDEGVECVTEYVEANPEDAAQVFSGGGSETETFFEQLGLACGEIVFGG